MDVWTRKVTVPISKESSGRRVVSPSEYPAATNRLIRWIYDGWRGEIGSWPRVNLACVKVGEGCQGVDRGERRTPDRFPAGFMLLFFIRTRSRRRRTLRHGAGGGGDTVSRRARFSARASVSLRFWHAARIPRNINATANSVESFNQSAPMTLGILAVRTAATETKLCTRPKMGSAASELKNGSLSRQCSQSRARAFVRGSF